MADDLLERIKAEICAMEKDYGLLDMPYNRGWNAALGMAIEKVAAVLASPSAPVSGEADYKGAWEKLRAYIQTLSDTMALSHDPWAHIAHYMDSLAPAAAPAEVPERPATEGKCGCCGAESLKLTSPIWAGVPLCFDCMREWYDHGETDAKRIGYFVRAGRAIVPVLNENEDNNTNYGDLARKIAVALYDKGH